MRSLLVVSALLAATSALAHVKLPPSPAPAAPTTTAPAGALVECAQGPGGVGGGAKVRVMLLDLKSEPQYASMAKGLGQIVAAEAARVPGYQILSAEEVRTALDQEANKSLAGCDENSCLAELAQALDAELVVGGRIDEARGADRSTLVSLTLLNSRAIVVVNRVTMSWPGDPKALPDVVRAAAQTLLLEPKLRPPGTLKLLGLPQRAHVFVDGADESAAFRRGEIGPLAVGPHEIKVETEESVPAVAHAVINAGAATALEIALEPKPTPGVWLWVGGGAAVVAGGAAVLGLALALGQGSAVLSANVPSVSANDVETIKGAR